MMIFWKVLGLFVLLLFPTAGTATSIAGFGDSITCEGCDDGSYLGLLPTAINALPGGSSLLPITTIGKGESAKTSDEIRDILDLWLDSNISDYLVLLAGTVDTYTTLTGFKSRAYDEDETVGFIRDALILAQNAGISVVLVAPPPVQDPCDGPVPNLTCTDIDNRLMMLRDSLSLLASERGVPFVDLYEAFTSDGRFSNTPGDADSLYLEFGLHPQYPTGDQLIADLVAQAIVPEPGTAELLGLSLLGLVGLHRRQPQLL